MFCSGPTTVTTSQATTSVNPSVAVCCSTSRQCSFHICPTHSICIQGSSLIGSFQISSALSTTKSTGSTAKAGTRSTRASTTWAQSVLTTITVSYSVCCLFVCLLRFPGYVSFPRFAHSPSLSQDRNFEPRLYRQTTTSTGSTTAVLSETGCPSPMSSQSYNAAASQLSAYVCSDGTYSLLLVPVTPTSSSSGSASGGDGSSSTGDLQLFCFSAFSVEVTHAHCSHDNSVTCFH